MNKKIKLNLLAMTLLVSQQMYCSEDKNQNAKKTIEKKPFLLKKDGRNYLRTGKRRWQTLGNG